MEAADSDKIQDVAVDPYKHLDHLGHGAYGYVDKVGYAQPQGSGATAVFARKVIRKHQGGTGKPSFEVLDIYQHKNRLNILMQQVADCDLVEYLQVTDELQEMDPLKFERKTPMLKWTGCLIRAIDYLHEMRIKHKDLKPANILIKNEQVLIADFGISKDLTDSETTASLSANGDIGTKMYCAPEVLQENGRRGRASDIYSVGCIFLEISTVLVSQSSGALKIWSNHREGSGSGSRLYSNCSSQILQWIRYLTSLVREHVDYRHCLTMPSLGTIYYGIGSAEVAFFMLDPNPRTRITAHQMVALLQPGSKKDYFFQIKKKSCHLCRDLPSAQDPNIPLHSVIKIWPERYYPRKPDDALKELVAGGNWEQAKRLWLESHMWW